MPPSSQAAYQSLTAFKPRDTQQVTAEAESKYDIPGYTSRLSSMRGLVGNLQNSVEAVDPSVTGRTSGTFTTEGQRQALVSKERTPILADLSKQQGALGIEQQGFTTAQGLASQMASALMAEDRQGYQRLLDQYNAAVAAERAAEEKRRYDEQQAEQKRQFDESQKAAARTAGGAGGYNLSGLSGALGGGSSPAPSGGGGFRSVLSSAASKGDKNAELALKYVGDDGNYYIDFANPRNKVENWPAIKRALDAVGAKNVFQAPTQQKSIGQHITDFLNIGRNFK